MNKKRFIIVGNPNSGKTSLFNILTKSMEQTGNWAGVTILRQSKEIHQDFLSQMQAKAEIIDTPGIYSLVPDGLMNVEQCEVIEALNAYESFDGFINILDSMNIERGLYLTLQLMQLDKPILLCINFADYSFEDGWINAIYQVFGIKAVKLSTHNKCGLDEVISWIINPSKDYELILHHKVQEAVEVAKRNSTHKTNLDIMLDIEQNTDDQEGSAENAILMMSQRLELIKKARMYVDSTKKISKWQARIDNAVFHPICGPIIFCFIMICMFTFSIVIGGKLQDPLEILAHGFLVEGSHQLLANLGFPQWFNFIFSNGLCGGITTVIAFIPLVLLLFISLSYLQESGYIARAAVMADGVLKRLGLPGAAFIPLIIGFGCNVPAIASVRSLDSFQSKVKTALMLPFMSCSARLTVYAVFCSAFFKEYAALIIFALYIFGIIAAFLTGWILEKIAPSKIKNSLILELPPYRFPKFKIVFQSSFYKLKSFLEGAGKTIIMIFFAIQIASNILQSTNLYQGEIEAIKHFSVAPFKPMGLRDEDWPLVAGLMAGVIAKEVTVGTISALYQPDSVQHEFSPSQVLMDAWNEFIGVESSGNRDVYLSKILENAISDKAAIFAYLLFVLLYFPCVSVYAVTKQEVGLKWAVLSALWSTTFAYICAILFYQIYNLF